jgi:hypothetical protein
MRWNCWTGEAVERAHVRRHECLDAVVDVTKLFLTHRDDPA